MASNAKREWDTSANARLDELEQVHADARGTSRGRRWGTEQLNRSLFLVLVGQFQTYCRDLHDEAIDVHVALADRLRRLDVLIDFRNLVSHGNETDLHTFVTSNDIQPTLTSYRKYRRTVRSLTGTMDEVVAAQLASGLHVPRPS